MKKYNQLTKKEKTELRDAYIKAYSGKTPKTKIGYHESRYKSSCNHIN